MFTTFKLKSDLSCYRARRADRGGDLLRSHPTHRRMVHPELRGNRRQDHLQGAGALCRQLLQLHLHQAMSTSQRSVRTLQLRPKR